MIAVLAGGVGAARYLAGLVQVVDPAEITAVVNTADDVWLHGLRVCPDLDTVTYTLGGAVDTDRGWGLVDETWATMAALARYEQVAPPGSPAGLTWFRLGDRDLATHLYRTGRLEEGADLAEVTAEVTEAWGVRCRLVPMTTDTVETRVTLAPTPADGGATAELGFQEYFVQHRHSVAVSAVRFVGAELARPGPGVLEAIAEAERVVVAPSNPIVSIGPILAVPGVAEALTARRAHVVAVSPIVAGAALRGPADRLLTELGHDASVVGVARLYAPWAATLVVDEADAGRAGEVEAAGMRCVVGRTVMHGPVEAAALAELTLQRAPA
ncbi:MAG: 2-phospho-L-lactate transferase [Actinomycetota bacterium]|nr:2-phospho-L-lactate transferase [Actinomycetota bacterium]